MAPPTDPHREEPLAVTLPKIDLDRLRVLEAMGAARAQDAVTPRPVLPAPSPLEEVAQVKVAISRLAVQQDRIEAKQDQILDEIRARTVPYAQEPNGDRDPAD